ncbi:glycoside hydrolase family 26 protein [Metabacillus fastidiosus]|uniref:glycoside hydrolase family 26 protein n=1 Tax=Metabacillus fastidiosus TaxID=1458 RepID=UPI003D2E2B4A
MAFIKISIIFIFSLIIILNIPKSDAVPSTSIQSGTWLGEWPSSSAKNIESFESMTNYKQHYIHTFINTNQSLNDWKSFMDYTASTGAINFLTLELKKPDGTDYSTVDVNAGLLDEKLIKIANQLKYWNNGAEIYLRIMHEVNGNWYGWSIGDSNINTNETYKEAFIHIVQIFKNAGAENIKLIYNINAENIGANTSFMDAYPGDEYVDYVSMDGYNWGTLKTSEGSEHCNPIEHCHAWRSFRAIFDAPYNALTAHSKRPVIIAEYASSELGDNKAKWIYDVSYQLKSGTYPKLKAVIWFHENKERDWRVNSSDETLEAYKKLYE